MARRLSEAVYEASLTDEGGLLVRLCCDHCTERIGDYVAHITGLDDRIVLVEPGAYGRHEKATEVTKDVALRQQGLDRGPITQVRGYRETHGTYTWHCGTCDGNIQRREDRLGRLEIDDRFSPPRLYV